MNIKWEQSAAIKRKSPVRALNVTGHSLAEYLDSSFIYGLQFMVLARWSRLGFSAVLECRVTLFYAVCVTGHHMRIKIHCPGIT